MNTSIILTKDQLIKIKEIMDKYPGVSHFTVTKDYTQYSGEMLFVTLSLFDVDDVIINLTEEKGVTNDI